MGLAMPLAVAASAQSVDVVIAQADSLVDIYDFSGAAAKLASAQRQLKKAPEFQEDAADVQRRIDIAHRMLDHVERLVILDSIAVPEEEFFTAYRLPASAGRLLAPKDIPVPELREEASMAYANEAGDFMMWSMPDSVGTLRIREASRLTDGSWQYSDFADLNMGGDADFPFLSADGTMLYFAEDGDESLGGYDIFVATRDPQTGEYLKPSNLGMPFNSPFDDYMIAYDETNGVGWWATDRNRLPGQVTVYLFQMADTRENIDPEDENLMDYARILDYKSTQPEGEDYSDLLGIIRAIDPNATTHEDFRIPVKGGKVLTLYDELPDEEARQAVRDYLQAEASLKVDEDRLRKMRHEYAETRSDELAKRIKGLEQGLELERNALRKNRSAMYRTLNR